MRQLFVFVMLLYITCQPINLISISFHYCRGVEIQCQWHQLSGAKSELGTTGLIIGNLLLSTLLKNYYMKFNEHIKD